MKYKKIINPMIKVEQPSLGEPDVIVANISIRPRAFIYWLKKQEGEFIDVTIIEDKEGELQMFSKTETS